MFSQFGSPKSASGKTERDGKWVLPGEYAKRLDRIDKARQAGHQLVPPAAEQDPVRMASLLRVLCAPSRRRTGLQELAFYLRTYRASGILHPLNYYRTQKLCFEEEQRGSNWTPVPHDQHRADGGISVSDSGIPAAFPAQIPAYFLTGDSDEALPLAMSDNSPRLFKGEYSREIVPGADHWLLQVSDICLSAPSPSRLTIDHLSQHRQYRDEASARLIRWADANSGSHYPLVEKAKL